jgi:hypothetical protein
MLAGHNQVISEALEALIDIKQHQQEQGRHACTESTQHASYADTTAPKHQQTQCMLCIPEGM